MDGNSSQAEVECLTPQQIDTRHAHKFLERALNQFGRGEHEAALLGCRQAVGLAPNSFPAHSLLSMLNRRENDLDAAIAQSEKAIAILPSHELERERLAELRLARTNNAPSPALRLGEWEQFRQEMLREIKLSDLLASQKLEGATSVPPQNPTPFGEPLSFSSANPETSQFPIAASAVRPNFRSRNLTISIGVAVAFIGLIIYFSTRSAQVASPSQPQNTTATIVTQTNKPDYSQINGEQPGANPTPSLNPAQSPQAPVSIPGASSAPNQTRPVQAGSTPSTAAPQTPSRPQVVERPPVRQQPTPAQPTERTSRPSVVEKPAAPSSPPPRNQRPRTSVPQYSPPAPAVSAAEPPPAKSTDDVGPRFSTPAQGDDVGPRFSTP